MSGKIGDNTGRASGLTKAASSAPTSAAGNPAVDRDESVGTRYINTTSGELFICTDASAGENVWTGQLGTSVAPPTWDGGRGVFAGGTTGSYSDVMDYITISTTGNATDFGNLVAARKKGGGLSSGSRGVFAGGGQGASASVNVIEYITISTTGNGTDFGDLTADRDNTVPGVSNGTRGVFCGGRTNTPSLGTKSDILDYITIATAGNATDFGDLPVAGDEKAGCNNDTRGVVMGGGDAGGYANVIDYFNIASVGNASDFGDITAARGAGPAGCSNGTIGLIGGGYEPSANVDIIEYITIASAGNATDFGDLTSARNRLGAVSDRTKGVWGGGGESPHQTTIDYVTISSAGNASDFGDLTAGRSYLVGCAGD